MARHQQLVKERNIHPVYQEAPAPPLIWPDWLVRLGGGKVAALPGVDQSKNECLKYRFVSSAPMTSIFAFYKDLLDAHDYAVHSSKLETGQTISGIVQNADGYVEGTNYPNGFPGPRTVIHIGFSRFHLNDPIDVNMRFTTYAFKAPAPFGR